MLNWYYRQKHEIKEFIFQFEKDLFKIAAVMIKPS